MVTGNPDCRTEAYLFVHFTGDEEAATDEQLYFALSRDGIHWTDLRRRGDPILTWTQGERGVRDPFITRGPDGVFHILATDLSIYHRGGWSEQASVEGSTGLVIWESSDLIHWGEPHLVDVASAIPGAGMAWAPEASWDSLQNQWIVYWSTRAASNPPDHPLANSLGEAVNMYYAVSKDLRTFSAPVKWIDRRADIIDTTMIQTEDGWWYRASKDDQISIERTRNPYAVCGEVVRTDDPDQWSYVGSLTDILGRGRYSSRYLEGPELFLYNDRDASDHDRGPMPFGLMCDQFEEARGYLTFRSANLASTDSRDWQVLEGIDYGNLKKRHGAIMPITSAEYQALEAAFRR